MSEDIGKGGAIDTPGGAGAGVVVKDPVLGGRLKTPRAAAFAGILFSVLIALSSVLIKISFPQDLAGAARWLNDSTYRDVAVFALNLVPFAGIAFLWFIGVVRDHLGEREDRFFATVFLGSGLIYIAMIFVAAGMTAGLLTGFNSPAHAAMISPGAWLINRNTALAVQTLYATRMAAVFTISTATIYMRTRSAPRWLAICGFGAGLVLLFCSNFSEWLSLLFPAWVLLVSLSILKVSLSRHREKAAGLVGEKVDAKSGQ